MREDVRASRQMRAAERCRARAAPLRRAAATRQGPGLAWTVCTSFDPASSWCPRAARLPSSCFRVLPVGVLGSGESCPHSAARCHDATAFSKPQVSVFDFSQGLQQGNSDSLSFACDVSSTAAPSSSKVHRQGAAAVRGSGQTSRHREPCGYAA